MIDGNTPEGTAEPAWTVDEAADAISGLLSDDPDTDTGAPEDTPKDDAEAEPAEALESDLDDEDETEADDAEDDAEDEDPEADEQFTASDDMEITLDDGSTISLGDLKKGNLRHADYTRKTQDLAETKRQYEAKDQQLNGAARNLVQQYEILEQVLTQSMPQRPTAQMAHEDPLGYQQSLAAFQDHQERVQAAQIQLQQARQHEEQRTQMEKQELHQRALNDLIAWKPEFSDMGKLRAFGQKLAADMSTYGLSFDDINQLTDVRMLKVMADAAKYQELQKSKPKAIKKVQKAPPMTKPQQRQSQKGQMRQAKRKQMDRLRKTGSVDDAANFLEGIIT